MKITLIRHAQIDQKYQGHYNGHLDIGLSKQGYKDAKEFGKKLDCKEFDTIYCSDLKRAKETIKQFSCTQKIIYTDKLREKSWGKHEGMSFDEIISKDEIKYENFLQWIKALDGEDYESYIKRIKKFFIHQLPSTNKKNILIVTHAGVIRTLLHIFKDITLEEAFSIKVPYLHTICVYPS